MPVNGSYLERYDQKISIFPFIWIERMQILLGWSNIFFLPLVIYLIFRWEFFLYLTTWRTMEVPLRHINCRNLTLESAVKLTNMSSRIQDTTYFAIFFRRFKGQILLSVVIIFIRKGASIEPPWTVDIIGKWRNILNKAPFYHELYHELMSIFLWGLIMLKETN